MDEKSMRGKGAQPPAAATFAGGKDNGLLVDSASQQGAFALVTGGSVSSENGALVLRSKETVTAGPDGGRAEMPTSLFFTFRGTSGVGSELVGRYHAMDAARR
jgi:hypothetical protein